MKKILASTTVGKTLVTLSAGILVFGSVAMLAPNLVFADHGDQGGDNGGQNGGDQGQGDNGGDNGGGNQGQGGQGNWGGDNGGQSQGGNGGDQGGNNGNGGGDNWGGQGGDQGGQNNGGNGGNNNGGDNGGGQGDGNGGQGGSQGNWGDGGNGNGGGNEGNGGNGGGECQTGTSTPPTSPTPPAPPVAPTLSLSDTVDNTAGGTATAADWILSATGATTTPTNLNGSSTVSSGTGFLADTYVLSEVGDTNTTNYTAGTWTCTGATVTGNSITLADGDTAVCSIVNTYVAPTTDGGGNGGDNGGGDGNPTPSVTTPTGGGGGNGGGSDVGVEGGTIGGGNGGGNGGNGGLHPQVLGASCGPILSSYLRLGHNNPSDQVEILQNFLNSELGTNIPVTGYFGKLTLEAVNQFQIKYNSKVLAPWVAFGLPSADDPTGYVFKTTEWQVNEISCPTLDLPQPQLP